MPEASSRQMTKVFKALAHSTRQDILQRLEEEQRSVGEIVSRFNSTDHLPASLPRTPTSSSTSGGASTSSIA